MTALAGLGRSALAAREKTDGRADRGADAQDKSARHADGGAGAQAAAEHTEHAEQLVIHVKDAKTGRIDVFRGTSLTRLHDPELAARLVLASRQ